MTTTAQLIDISALREYLGSGGPWAIDAGAKVARKRTEFGWSETRLAALVGVTATTVRQIESGALVPREYLRSAIAFSLGQDVEFFWPPLTRRRAGEIGQVL